MLYAIVSSCLSLPFFSLSRVCRGTKATCVEGEEKRKAVGAEEDWLLA